MTRCGLTAQQLDVVYAAGQAEGLANLSGRAGSPSVVVPWLLPGALFTYSLVAFTPKLEV